MSKAISFIVAFIALAAVADVSSALLYNVTVQVSPMTKQTEGKLWVLLEGYTGTNTFKHEVRLHEHSAPLRPNSYYTFMTDVPYTVNTITGLQIKYKKRNILQRNSIGLSRVTVTPQYMPIYERFRNSKSFCPAANVVEVKNEVWFRFPTPC